MERDLDFSAFTAATRRRLLRTAFLLCGDWHAAEDAVQTALVKLYLAWPRVEPTLGPDAYAHAILVHSLADARRRPWRREVPYANTQLPDRDRVTREQAPDDHTELHEAVLALPPRQRQVVILRHFGGYSVQETAAILAISDGSVKSHSSRGLQRLALTLRIAPVEEVGP